MATVDLEVEIGRNTGGSYPVIARAGGEVGTAHLPVASVEALNRRLVVLGSVVLTASAVSRPAAVEDVQRMRELGRQLFDALIAGEVRDLYVAGRQRAREQGSTMRLLLGVRPVELARLPWEYLFDSDQDEYLGLGLSLVRYPEVLAPRQPLQAAAPLRILGMVGHSPDPDTAVGTDAQRHRLVSALAGLADEGLVELGWVSGHTAGNLEDALAQGPWQAFHFIGRGGYDWIGDDFSRLLADHHTLRLVVLDICGSCSDRVSDGFAGAAGALVRQGIPAVVAMQIGMADPAVIEFAQTLYHSVVKFLPVDIGVLRARRALRLTRKDTFEWGTPTLYLRAPAGRIFHATVSTSGPAGNQVDALHDEALEAFWAEQWDQAVTGLRKVLAERPGHPDATAKLELARHEQDLITRHTRALAAVDAGDWEQAVEEFAVLADADPTDLSLRDRLADAHRRQEAAVLLAQARQGSSESASPPVGSPRLARRPRTGQILHARREVNAVAFSPDGRRLATVHSKNVAQIWDTTNGQELLSLGAKAWRRNMEAVAFSPDGSRLATASDDGTARVWDADSGDELLKVTHDSRVRGVAFSPDGGRLATAGDDGTARLWDADCGQELAAVTHDNWVRAVAFSPDGGRLTTAGVDCTARVWDADSGDELLKVTHDSLVWAVAFSPDGCWLATASADGTARVWDATDGRELGRITHDNWVRGVAFSPDGRYLATASQDGTAQVWEFGSGQEPATVVHADQVWGVAFSPDGRYLATASADKTARIWVLLYDDEPASAPVPDTPPAR